LNFPLLSDLPVLGPILFNHNALVYLTLILVVVTSVILEKTTFGLKVRAVGEHPRAADSKGINVQLIRYICVAIGGIYAGLGGAFLSIGFMNTFLDQMVAGRGFIAVAVVIFARWNPYRALGAALLFGGANALQLRLQAMGVAIPHQFLLALPYVLTVLVLISVSKKAEFPAAYTIPYSRAER
jgi:simple sugar transport system permease protein